MDKIELVATINIRYIPVYSEYMEILTEKGSMKVQMVVRVGPDHVETAQRSIDEFLNSVKDNQVYKENIANYINKGRTIIKTGILNLDKESYDILISG